MKDENQTTDFIVTTTNGTRWAETGVSFGQVRRQFFGKRVGMEIEKIERGRLFTPEEEEEIRAEWAVNKAERDAIEYQENRRGDYPSIQDQLDQI